MRRSHKLVPFFLVLAFFSHTPYCYGELPFTTRFHHINTGDSYARAVSMIGRSPDYLLHMQDGLGVPVTRYYWIHDNKLCMYMSISVQNQRVVGLNGAEFCITDGSAKVFPQPNAGIPPKARSCHRNKECAL